MVDIVIIIGVISGAVGFSSQSTNEGRNASFSAFQNQIIYKDEDSEDNLMPPDDSFLITNETLTVPSSLQEIMMDAGNFHTHDDKSDTLPNSTSRIVNYLSSGDTSSSTLSSTSNMTSSINLTTNMTSSINSTSNVTSSINSTTNMTSSINSTTNMTSSINSTTNMTSTINSTTNMTSTINSTTNMTSTINSTSNKTSSTVMTSAETFTSVYQPVIHLEQVSRNDLLSYLRSTKNGRTANETRNVTVPVNAVGKHVNRSEDDSLSQKQIRSIFKLARFAKPFILRCRKPEATILVKCVNNIARITFTSDSDSRMEVKASVYGLEDELAIDGYKVNTYLIWAARKEVKPRLKLKFTQNEAVQDCANCDSFESMIKLEGESHACLIPINCGKPRSERVIFDISKGLKHSTRYIPIITVSMALHSTDNKEASLTIEETLSGKPVNILIQGTSDSTTVGLYVKECSVMTQNLKSLVLSNGCSISNLLDNFKAFPRSASQVNYYGTSASFIPFSTKNLSENLTFSCSVMVCEGLCDVHSACQTSFMDHAKAMNSRKITLTTVELTFKIIPEAKQTENRSETNVSESSPRSSEVNKCQLIEAHNSISTNVCYFYLVLLSFLFLVLLLITIACFRHKTSVGKMANYDNEVESPPRVFYPEDCNTRRRSPNSSNY